jgi:hypothetical protein
MKTTKIILSVMVAFLFIVLAIGSGDSNDSDEQKETKEITDCSKSPDDYHDGYSAGKLCKIMGDRSSCETFVDDYNYKTGRDILYASDCYCEGFSDGQSGATEKYK